MRRRWQIASLTILAVVVTAAVFVGVRGRQAELQFPHGAELDPPKLLPEVALVGPDGAQVRLSDYRGRWLWIFFGYTHCPDVCPTTLGEMAREYRTLGIEAKRLQLLFISVDPDRDTPTRVSDYARYFHPEFVGLTGSREAIEAVAQAFGVRYRRRDLGSAAGYLVEHTAYVHVVDPPGRLLVLYPPGTKPGDLASDFAFLRR